MGGGGIVIGTDDIIVDGYEVVVDVDEVGTGGGVYSIDNRGAIVGIVWNGALVGIQQHYVWRVGAMWQMGTFRHSLWTIIIVQCVVVGGPISGSNQIMISLSEIANIYKHTIG